MTSYTLLAGAEFLRASYGSVPVRLDYRIMAKTPRVRDKAYDLAYATKYNAEHKEEVRERMKRWRAKNKEYRKWLYERWVEEHPDYRKTYMKAYHAKHYHKRYEGIDTAAYVAMCEAQGHLCAICQQAKRLFVDHNHTTGHVRGLLCQSCNGAIGYLERKLPSLIILKRSYFSKNSHLLPRALEYLKPRPLA